MCRVSHVKCGSVIHANFIDEVESGRHVSAERIDSDRSKSGLGFVGGGEFQAGEAPAVRFRFEEPRRHSMLPTVEKPSERKVSADPHDLASLSMELAIPASSERTLLLRGSAHQFAHNERTKRGRRGRADSDRVRPPWSFFSQLKRIAFRGRQCRPRFRFSEHGRPQLQVLDDRPVSSRSACGTRFCINLESSSCRPSFT